MLRVLCRDEIQNFRGEPRLRTIPIGDTVDNGNGFILATLVEKEFWRLEHVKEKESDTEHGKGDDANGHDEVTPPEVYRPLRNEEPRSK